MAKYHKLSKEQKEEFRRLTQQANRRIAAATKAYSKAGMEVAPKSLTGGYTVREKWFSDKYALSRSIKFESEKAYQEQLKFLRQFDPQQKDKNANYVPSLTEYAVQERANTIAAVESVLGLEDIASEMEGLVAKINRMSATELTAFWKAFTRKAQKMGVQYASVQAMEDTLREFFPEDMKGFDITQENNSMINDYKRDMMTSKQGL